MTVSCLSADSWSTVSWLLAVRQLIVRQQSANTGSQPTDFFKEFFSITENPLINVLTIAGHSFWQVTSPNKPFTVGFTLQNLSAEVSSDFINPLKVESDQHQISPSVIWLNRSLRSWEERKWSPPKKALIVQQILLVSAKGNIYRRV